MIDVVLKEPCFILFLKDVFNEGLKLCIKMHSSGIVCNLYLIVYNCVNAVS